MQMHTNPNSNSLRYKYKNTNKIISINANTNTSASCVQMVKITTMYDKFIIIFSVFCLFCSAYIFQEPSNAQGCKIDIWKYLCYIWIVTWQLPLDSFASLRFVPTMWGSLRPCARGLNFNLCFNLCLCLILYLCFNDNVVISSLMCSWPEFQFVF